MYRDKLEVPLARLGLEAQNFHALRVLPLLYVAWAKGRITEPERRQILTTARERLGLSADAMRLVHKWLQQPPSTAAIRDGAACLRLAATAVDQPDFGTDDLLHLLWDAEAMTHRVAVLTGVAYEPSQEQHDALLAMAELLGIDSGTPWHEMLLELGGREELARTLPATSATPVVRLNSPKPAERLRRWRTAYRQQSRAVPVPMGGVRLI